MALNPFIHLIVCNPFNVCFETKEQKIVQYIEFTTVVWYKLDHLYKVSQYTVRVDQENAIIFKGKKKINNIRNVKFIKLIDEGKKNVDLISFMKNANPVRVHKMH